MYSGVPAGVSACYSDDNGTTWRSTEQVFGGASAAEIEVAELNARVNATSAAPALYMTIRNDGDDPAGGRQAALSQDGGLTWGDRQSVQVPDPACKGSVVQWPQGPGLVLATAASCTKRVNQTIFLSLQDGRPGTWVYSQFVHPLSYV